MERAIADVITYRFIANPTATRDLGPDFGSVQEGGVVTDLTELEMPCMCAALRGAARSAAQLYDLVLEPTGLKATQFFILKTIAEAGEIPQWKFARDHAVAVETLSRRFATLRRKRLIAVRTGNHGEQIYSLTAEGSQTFGRALPYWERAQARLKQTLGRPQSQLLLQLCQRTAEAARDAQQLRTSNASAHAA